MAAAQLNVAAADIEFASGRSRARGNPDNAVSFSRLAATSHWSPGLVAEENQALRETVFWTPPELTPPTKMTKSIVALSRLHLRFLRRRDRSRSPARYVSTNTSPCTTAAASCTPAWWPGRSRGGFAHAVGAALYEEFAYGRTAASSPAHLPTIWCRPRWKC